MYGNHLKKTEMYHSKNERLINIKTFEENDGSWVLISEKDEVENIKCVLDFCEDMEKMGGVENLSFDKKTGLNTLESINPTKTKKVIRTWSDVRADEIIEKHIDDIRVGDSVFHDGKVRTVGKNSIKYDSFMGRSLWGDSYHTGHKLVKVLCI